MHKGNKVYLLGDFTIAPRPMQPDRARRPRVEGVGGGMAGWWLAGVFRDCPNAQERMPVMTRKPMPLNINPKRKRG